MQTDRERFRAIMAYEAADRIPVYYFGTWRETMERWRSEGYDDRIRSVDGAPYLPGMDPDWEAGMWGAQGLVTVGAVSDEPTQELDRGDDYTVVRTPLGAVLKQGAHSTIPQHLEHALKPTRPAWQEFKRFIDPHDPSRRPDDWVGKASAFNARTRVGSFMAGSLFGWLREWLGIEAISLLPYDDPKLFDEMVATMADYFMALYEPVLEHAQFDFAYFFEDCCCNTGPLYSPATYERFFASHYRRMAEFYHSRGVELILIDSDGKVDVMIPHWLDSGFDIVFPIEVGTWEASPAALRDRFGTRLRMFGGVDKHVIPQGDSAVRAHLTKLLPVAEEGGFIPIPDHRIPPDCGLDQFLRYVEIFNEVFNS